MTLFNLFVGGTKLIHMESKLPSLTLKNNNASGFFLCWGWGEGCTREEAFR